jgi:hypothetical protein
MDAFSIIFIVLGIIAIINNINKWISEGENQLSEIIWIVAAIIWCINSQLR